MKQRLETIKYVFTVEGETEKWYMLWLRDQINNCDSRTYNISVDVSIEQVPRKFYKRTNSFVTPEVYHICDIEGEEEEHIIRLKNVFSEMKDAKKDKGINYFLGYSNLTFELWMILHKKDCNSHMPNRKQYLSYINDVYGLDCHSLKQYKKKQVFEQCLSQLSIQDVREAVRRANDITTRNINDDMELVKYKGYSYYKSNPALSINEVVSKMLDECELI